MSWNPVIVPDHVLRWLFSLVGKLVLVIVVLAIIIPLAGPLSVWAMPLVMVLWAVAIWRIRRRRARAVIGYLYEAVRTELPLATILQAGAADEDRRTRSRIDAVAKDLTQGLPLDRILRDKVPEMSSRALALVESGQRTGRLDAVLTYLVMTDKRHHHDEDSDPMADFGYLLMLLTFIPTIVLGYLIFVMPKLNAIFADFGAESHVTHIYRWFINHDITLFLLGIIACVGLLLPLALVTGAGVVTARWIDAWRWLVDPIAWSLPGFRQFVRDRALADVFHVISESLRSGMPVHTAVNEAANLNINRLFRRRLRRWASDVNNGHDIDTAARNAGLPPMITGMLDVAHATGDLPRTLNFLSDYYQTRLNRTLMMLRGAIIPATVLIMGTIIALITMSVFLSITTLIEHNNNLAGMGGLPL